MIPLQGFIAATETSLNNLDVQITEREQALNAMGNLKGIGALIGAPVEDLDINGDGKIDAADAGAAYLFDSMTGTLDKRFTLGSQARASDYFGLHGGAIWQ